MKLMPDQYILRISEWQIFEITLYIDTYSVFTIKLLALKLSTYEITAHRVICLTKKYFKILPLQDIFK